ncbi:pyranose oxidase [Gigaspora margarita]|uniref:Pyranose oxidase n=1 Tax=Gigaspora margarita TaxID=4874 RepID=A0A8H4AXX3_GIGMA|nr:pyranose oxidase [Gigaspora margarita]
MNLKICFRLSIIFFAFIEKAYTLSKNEDSPIKNFDAVIVGSGPMGCTFARKLIEAGYKVAMVDVGASESNPPGQHFINAYRYQVDSNAFKNSVKAHMHLLSVPTSDDAYPDTLDQISTFENGTIHLNQNPDQDPQLNLRAEAASYCWWHGYSLEWRNAKTSKKSSELPLAVRYEKGDNPDEIPFNFRTGPHDILRKENFENKNFVLIEQHLAQILHPKIDNTSIIDGLIIKNLLKRGQNEILIKTKVFIICAGAVNTPQLLYNSMIKNSNWDIEIPALGKNLCEQTMTTCQIVLSKEIVKKMLEDPVWSEDVKKHKEAYPNDPIPIPFGVPSPHCSIPYTDKRPWYCEVFGGSSGTSYVDNRVTLGFNCFDAPHNSEELNNRVEFSKKNKDIYGMPQPMFYVRTSEKDAEINHKMFSDMTQTALSMGGFLPGNEPKFLPPGSALHMTGTVRMGTSKETSVVDTNLCVHGFRNFTLELMASSQQVKAITANPTLTSVALAIKSANDIIKKLKEGAFDF